MEIDLAFTLMYSLMFGGLCWTSGYHNGYGRCKEDYDLE